MTATQNNDNSGLTGSSEARTSQTQTIVESIKDRISGDDLAGMGFYEVEDMLLAAPDLLEALRTLRDMYVRNFGNPDSEFIACITPEHRKNAKKGDKYWAAFDAATAAIAKAEGKTI